MHHGRKTFLQESHFLQTFDKHPRYLWRDGERGRLLLYGMHGRQRIRAGEFADRWSSVRTDRPSLLSSYLKFLLIGPDSLSQTAISPLPLRKPTASL